MPAPTLRRRLARYAAPAAFLLAVTIAVLLIRSGLGGGSPAPATTALGPVTRASTVPVAPPATPTTTTPAATTAAGAQYYTVTRGDTFGSIAAKEGTTVTQLEQLNPGVSSDALQIGEKLRVR
ncbi:MAG: LysM domain-containing protein [Gaiellaceae bacterium]